MTSSAMMCFPKITLYLSPGACSLAPHIILHEIGARFDIVRLSTKSGLAPEFAKINPKQRIPILLIGPEGQQETVTEVPAILTAIAQLAPEKQLLGKTNLDIVKAYEWMNYLSGTLHGQGFGCLWRPARFSDDTSAFNEIRSKGRKTIEQCFEIIESKLTGPHAVGNDFSVVDAYLYVFWRWGSEIGVKMENFANFAILACEVAKREAVRVTLKVEGIASCVNDAKGGEQANL